MKFPLASMWLLACAVAPLPPAAANTIANETLIVFDDPHLVATTSSKGIRGYFNMQHQVLPFYCSSCSRKPAAQPVPPAPSAKN